MVSPKKRIALIGECLIELNGTPFGALHQTFGGDSLNTALYLARLIGSMADVRYVTAVGTDTLSDGMVQRWQSEGIDTRFVLRYSARLPGLYLVHVDARGERTFMYWRGDSAARYLMQHPAFNGVVSELAEEDLLYTSGIGLAILPPQDRAELLDLLRRFGSLGMAIAFDSNFRAALWQSADSAREAMAALLPATKLMFATFDDEQHLWGDETAERSLARLHASGARTVVLKLGAGGCLYSNGASIIKVEACPVTTVVDTTAAGDAFNAGFLAGWLQDYDPESCCRAGNALAAAVIQHRGAIIPAGATPSLATLLERLGPRSGLL
jgi:2-dehydro-3-deoxygluconokinase